MEIEGFTTGTHYHVRCRREFLPLKSEMNQDSRFQFGSEIRASPDQEHPRGSLLQHDHDTILGLDRSWRRMFPSGHSILPFYHAGGRLTWRDRFRRAWFDCQDHVLPVLCFPFFCIAAVVVLALLLAVGPIALCVFVIVVLSWYYCCTQAPIPPGVLLRAVLDLDQGAGSGVKPRMPLTRSLIETGLTRRECTHILSEEDTDPQPDWGPALTLETRRHQGPVYLPTETLCIRFSAPCEAKPHQIDYTPFSWESPALYSLDYYDGFHHSIDRTPRIFLRYNQPDTPLVLPRSEPREVSRASTEEAVPEDPNSTIRGDDDDDAKSASEAGTDRAVVHCSATEADLAPVDDDKDYNEDDNEEEDALDTSRSEPNEATIEEEPKAPPTTPIEPDSTPAPTSEPKPVPFYRRTDNGPAWHRHTHQDEKREEEKTEEGEPPSAIRPATRTAVTSSFMARPRVETVAMSETLSEPSSSEADESSVRERGAMCDICLLAYKVGDRVAWSHNKECDHCFHEDCITDWLLRKPTCPSCRQIYVDSEQQQQQQQHGR